MKKKLWSALVCALTVFQLVGCTNRNPDFEKGKTNLVVLVGSGGYGTDWLQGIIDAYEQKNDDVRLHIRGTTQEHQWAGQLQSGAVVPGDLIFSTHPTAEMYALGYLTDLTPVYEYRETTSGKIVAEKLGGIADAYRIDEPEIQGYSGLPYSNSNGGLLYNKDVLDGLFPDGYALPNTTDEWFALLDEVKDSGEAWGFVGAKTKEDYASYLATTWWGQYSGYEAFWNYSQGRYVEADGTVYELDARSVTPAGKEAAVRTLETLLAKKNGYTHTYSTAMTYQEAQVAFLGMGYSRDKRPVAFMANGDWFEREMIETLERPTLPQDVRYMKVPVISSLAAQCPTIENDETLSAVVEYIDGGKSRKPEKISGVSDADIARVEEARRSSYYLGCAHSVCVPKASKYTEIALDFLKFMTTDEANRIYAQTLGGLLLPYAEGKDYGVERSAFTASYESSIQSGINPLYLNYSHRIVYKGGLLLYHDQELLDALFVAQSADEYIDSEFDYYRTNWTNILDSAGLK